MLLPAWSTVAAADSAAPIPLPPMPPQPWQRKRQYASTSSGFVVLGEQAGQRYLLTNAHSVEYFSQVGGLVWFLNSALLFQWVFGGWNGPWAHSLKHFSQAGGPPCTRTSARGTWLAQSPLLG